MSYKGGILGTAIYVKGGGASMDRTEMAQDMPCWLAKPTKLLNLSARFVPVNQWRKGILSWLGLRPIA